MSEDIGVVRRKISYDAGLEKGVEKGRAEVLLRVKETLKLIKQKTRTLDDVDAKIFMEVYVEREFDRMFKTFWQSSKPEGLDNIGWV